MKKFLLMMFVFLCIAALFVEEKSSDLSPKKEQVKNKSSLVKKPHSKKLPATYPTTYTTSPNKSMPVPVPTHIIFKSYGEWIIGKGMDVQVVGVEKRTLSTGEMEFEVSLILRNKRRRATSFNASSVRLMHSEIQYEPDISGSSVVGMGARQTTGCNILYTVLQNKVPKTIRVMVGFEFHYVEIE